MYTVTKGQIIECLKHVMDPEVNLDIWTMGLVYDVLVRDDKSVYVLYTLTSPMCPIGSVIEGNIRTELASIGVTDVEFELTFDPAWLEPPHLREMLGI